MSNATQCSWPSGIHAFKNGACSRCGAMAPVQASAKPAAPIAVGDVILAEWAVGPAQRGSGWVAPRFANNLSRWVIVEVWAFGYSVAIPDNGGTIAIRDGEFIRA